jgi:hypothetical protein
MTQTLCSWTPAIGANELVPTVASLLADVSTPSKRDSQRSRNSRLPIISFLFLVSSL